MPATHFWLLLLDCRDAVSHNLSSHHAASVGAHPKFWGMVQIMLPDLSVAGCCNITVLLKHAHVRSFAVPSMSPVAHPPSSKLCQIFQAPNVRIKRRNNFTSSQSSGKSFFLCGIEASEETCRLHWIIQYGILKIMFMNLW